jgi:hypothetical protein
VAVASAAIRCGNRGSGASRGAAGVGGVSNGGGGKQLVSPHALAKDSAGLCLYHWNFGDSASKCRPHALGRETSNPGSGQRRRPCNLVHLVDQLSMRRFLVDTGASYSNFPHSSTSVAAGPRLIGPSGQPIKCWGERRLEVLFDRRRFSWTFLLADVAFKPGQQASTCADTFIHSWGVLLWCACCCYHGQGHTIYLVLVA